MGSSGFLGFGGLGSRAIRLRRWRAALTARVDSGTLGAGASDNGDLAISGWVLRLCARGLVLWVLGFEDVGMPGLV